MRTLSSLMNMEGRVALVTGGSGHIGRAAAASLAELRCAVCLLDRDQAALDQAAAEVRTRFGGRAETLRIDLEDESQRLSVAGRVQDLFGRLDVLVNNAGFVGERALEGWAVPFEQQSIATWRRAVEVNMTAAFHLVQLLTPMLRQHGCGSVINMGSIYGVAGPDMRLYDDTAMGNPAAYAASKGGLIQATRWLASVLAPQVRVNAISPGGVARNQPEPFVRRYVERTPMGRMGAEEDFMGAIAYLSSDLSAWVTGQNLMVDGGWTVW